MDYRVPLEEQETVINLFPAQVSKKAEVYSCIPSMVKRLKTLAGKRPDAVKIVSDYGYAVTAEMDKSCIKISPKRVMTEEQRRAATDRLADARERKGSHDA